MLNRFFIYFKRIIRVIIHFILLITRIKRYKRIFILIKILIRKFKILTRLNPIFII